MLHSSVCRAPASAREPVSPVRDSGKYRQRDALAYAGLALLTCLDTGKEACPSASFYTAEPMLDARHSHTDQSEHVFAYAQTVEQSSWILKCV